MRRRLLLAVPLTVGATLAATALYAGSLSSASAAGPPKPPPIATNKVEIHSEVFTPYKRFPDSDSNQARRYMNGPGSAPNRFSAQGVGSEDAFFNTPDFTIGSSPMSAVSAEVCMTVSGPLSGVFVQFGVQDIDGSFILAPDPDGVSPDAMQVTNTSPRCRTMTFAHPVRLVNHPHIVTAIIQYLAPYEEVSVDGVTYTLQPTLPSDVTPQPSAAAAARTWFSIR